MKEIRAYGDRQGDGMVQMSFTLPIEPSAKAKEAAKRFAELHGLAEPLVTTMEECAKGFSFFVVYGNSKHAVDLDAINAIELVTPIIEREEIESRGKKLGRKIVVVGACTGSDAHTVGIDAMLNYKGFAGDKGLESYKAFDTVNMGAQVENTELAARARAIKADAILISQVITQRNCHKENASAFVELAKAEGFRDDVLLLLGGPRIDHKLGLELGFDAGFGPGTKPGQVAALILEHVEAKLKNK
jgi:beta-lysine 5,6-aminomutase beta subunit